MRSITIAFLITFSCIASALPTKVFTNPLIPDQNAPDPGAIFYRGNYYVVATVQNNVSNKFPIFKSSDLQEWEHVADVFPAGHLPTWANPTDAFWAPEIHIINDTFKVYFAARENATGILCIGVGSADNILGPYTDSGAPLVKNTTVGSIDATVMTLENNTYYLLWKDDGNGNNPQIPTWIWAQELTNDGLALTGEKYQLIQENLPWEGDLVEGPWVIKRGGWYYLFYSGFCYCDSTYSVGVARSRNPLGPYEKKGDPILKSNSVWVGPGHCSVIRDNQALDQYVMLYHSWYEGGVCGDYNRLLMIDFVHWSLDEWPYIKGSTPSSMVSKIGDLEGESL